MVRTMLETMGREGDMLGGVQKQVVGINLCVFTLLVS